MNLLQPGDILYIDGKPGGKVTHAITWLGQFGVDSKGVYSTSHHRLDGDHAAARRLEQSDHPRRRADPAVRRR